MSHNRDCCSNLLIGVSTTPTSCSRSLQTFIDRYESITSVFENALTTNSRIIEANKM